MGKSEEYNRRKQKDNQIWREQEQPNRLNNLYQI